jgi:hypothetical protein
VANLVYKKALENFLAGNLDLDANTVKAVLVTTDGGTPYTVNPNTDDALADVPAGARVGTTAALAGKTVTDGVFDAADSVVDPGPASGTTVEAIVVYVEGGSEATSWLLCYLDTGLGLPLTTNGAPIDVVWDNGANRIVKLG